MNTTHMPTERVLQMIDLVSQSESGLSLSELSKLSGCPKSTISPILKTLVDKSYIKTNDKGLFVIGISTYLAGTSYHSSQGALEIIKEQMQLIVNHVGEISQLGVRRGSQVLYIAKVDSDERIRLISSIGKKLPINCTAIGKALLYGKQESEIRQIFTEPLQTLTPSSTSSLDSLIQQVNQINQTKYATEKEEATEGICCFAVPILFHNKTVASISVSVPLFRYSKEKEELIHNELLNASNVIELLLEDIGWDGSDFSV